MNDDLELFDNKIPHMLKYMGSKREILSFITEAINSLDIKDVWFCDLMSGSGIVTGALKGSYNIHANDIQNYSSILTNTYLSNLKDTIKPQFITDIKLEALKFIKQFRDKYPDLEFCYDEIDNLESFQNVEKKQQELIKKEFDIGFHLFTKYYSGTYWSFEQCLWIDSIRAIAEKYIGRPEYFAILSSLIYSMSYNAQSTGHYAQYREAYNDSSMTDIMSYRKKDIWSYFEKKFNELSFKLNGSIKNYKVTSLDYVDCLRIIEDSSIVYVDPPYQSVHYSRFYHTLETLVKYDYPKVQFKGRYREDRHQSPFCKKTTVDKAFKNLFEGIKKKKAHIVLSYSNNGMISLEKIEEIANSIFGNTYKKSREQKNHLHSKLGRNDKKYLDVTEHLLIYERK